MIPDLATWPRRYVTVPDLIAYTGIPKATVYWHIRFGHLPVVRFGHRMRIETHHAREWVDLYASLRQPLDHHPRL